MVSPVGDLTACRRIFRRLWRRQAFRRLITSGYDPVRDFFIFHGQPPNIYCACSLPCIFAFVNIFLLFFDKLHLNRKKTYIFSVSNFPMKCTSCGLRCIGVCRVHSQYRKSREPIRVNACRGSRLAPPARIELTTNP